MFCISIFRWKGCANDGVALVTELNCQKLSGMPKGALNDNGPRAKGREGAGSTRLGLRGLAE